MEASVIGDAAGHIWQYLSTHGAASFPQLRLGTQLSERLLYLGAGWLAREGKLAFRLHRGVLLLELEE